VRWLSEHRRLLVATTVLVLLVAAALASVGGGSSAAQRSGRPARTSAALVASGRALGAERAQVKQLQALTSRQSVEISSLRAQLNALRHHQAQRHHHHRRHHRKRS
jgi:TolA-binding protein